MSDPAEELQELHEHAEHGHHSNKAGVSFTMSLLAVLLAAVTVLGHRAHTEEIVLQNQATDQWNYYQAKNQRRYVSEATRDLAGALAAEKGESVSSKYEKAAERYKEETEEIRKEAEQLQNEQKSVTRRGNRFDLGEGLLEVALVICSLTLLTGRRIFWPAGVLFGIGGIVVAASAFFLH